MRFGAISRLMLTTACGFALAVPAYAQTADEEAVDGEIIVTAQNREQNLNDVPIAISVVTGEQLKASGFSNLDNITQIAPSVQLNQDQGTVKVTVRGVGTGSNDEAQDTSVVVNIDGEYINRPNVLGSAIFDIERVEVLRGPQGTLYGRNSTGGAINFITRKPGKDFGIDASASYGNYNAVRLDAGVDVPVGDKVAVRVAGFYDERDGYVSHPARAAFGPFPAFAGGRSDDNRGYGGRVSVRLDPSDVLTINLSAEYSDRRFTPQVNAGFDFNVGSNGPRGPGCNALGFVRVSPNSPQTLCIPSGTNAQATFNRGRFFAPNFGLGRIGNDTYALRGRIAYELSDNATLTYTGGYRSFSGDSDSFLTLPVVYRSFNFMNEIDTQSHELRLNGEIGKIVFQVGGFYFKETLDSESGFFVPIGANGTFLSYFGRDVTSDSRSLFGQVDVPLTETLTAVGGLRYTDNDRKAVFQNASPFGAMGPDPALFNAGPARKSFANLRYASTLNLNPPKEDKVTWLVGLNYKPNSDTLFFVKASTGFKAGGFDSVGAYKPETNTAIEGGWKQSFGTNSQHQFNLGVFHYDYRDLQVAVLLDTTIGGQTFNAGKAEIYGIEAEANFEINKNNIFRASVNYLNAEYKRLLAQFNVYTVPGTGPDITGLGDLDPLTPGVQQPDFAGNRPGFSPTVIITAGYDHIIPLGSAGDLTASVNTTFKSSYFTGFFNYRDDRQKPFSQTDFSLTYKPESKKYTIQAFVRNIENARPLTGSGFVAAGPDDIYNFQFGTPRTYGLRVAVDF